VGSACPFGVRIQLERSARPPVSRNEGGSSSGDSLRGTISAMSPSIEDMRRPLWSAASLVTIFGVAGRVIVTAVEPTAHGSQQ